MKIKPTEIVTNELFWDCECDTKYIHKKEDSNSCAICGSLENESPDSRQSEIDSGKYFAK